MKCTRCNTDKDESCFGWRNKADLKRQSWCKTCFSIERKIQYLSYKKRGLQRAASARMREKVRAFINDAKNKPCIDCGIKYPPVCMDFDHLRDKKHNVSRMLHLSVERVSQEISKCDVVCSNCHRIRTFNRRLAQSS